MAIFQLKNLVFPADTQVTVTVFCNDPAVLKKIEAGYISGDGCHQDRSMPDSLRKFEPIPFNVCGNNLDFQLMLRGEGFHTIKLQFEIDGQSDYEYLEFYSLYEDLFKLNPYKGNFHSHTTDSDGLHSPQNTLCIAREAGFDYAAFSEHRLYTDHTDEFEGLCDRLGTKLFHAEEVHSLPRWVCHILSIGANAGVSQLQSSEPFIAEVEKAKNNYTELDQTLQSYAAQSEVITKYIKMRGGKAVLCHPYWKHTGRLNVPKQLTDILFRKIAFDAVELITCEYENNSLANARYHELAAEGKALPVMAGNDWHGQNGERMECAYNISFAEDCSETGIIDAIVNRRNTAVFGENDPMVFGDFRMVSYALFLIKNFYPAYNSVSEQLGLDILCSIDSGEFSSRSAELKAQLDLMKMMLKY